MKKYAMAALLLCVTVMLWSVDWVEQAQKVESLEEGELFLLNWEAEEPSKKSELALGILYHQLSQIDPEQYLGRGEDILQSQNNPLGIAYYGSLLTLKANQVQHESPLYALQLLQEGAQYIDQAVEVDSQNIDILLLRVANGVEVSLTSPFNRFPVIQQDREKLRAFVENCDDPGQKAIFAYYLGEIYLFMNDWDEALDAFYLSLESDPDSPWADNADNQIFLLEE